VHQKKKPVQLVLERALPALPTRFSRIYWTLVRARKLNIKSAQSQSDAVS
jgi:hypothetical protein